ncbi:MAG: c-type cytochrome [Ferruginibacter sp.]
MKNALKSNWFLVVLFTVIFAVTAYQYFNRSKETNDLPVASIDSTWSAPSLYLDQLTAGKERQMIIYGEQLVANTSRFLGPNGSVAHISNGMNCQNCHLSAGTLPWGNNYGAVYSTYPKYRARSNSIDNIYKRINDCFERSLGGSALDTNSYELQSMYAYMKWLGKDVPRGKKPYSSGLPLPPFMSRAANAANGKMVYMNTCQRCHGTNGEGLARDNGSYQYPPLWGSNSYTDGAGLYRITRFASFIKSNMPFDQATHANPVLTNEQAWDVAAFVNSQPRPHLDQSGDWKVIDKKAIDEPFGPYVDNFPEEQHKYGPFGPIDSFYKNKDKAVTVAKKQ